jgi:acyl carrier protein
MDPQAVESRVYAVIYEVLRVPPEKTLPQSRLREDLGADSLDLVMLMMAFEDEFKSTISKEQEAGLATVSAVVEFVKAQVAATAGAQ